MTDRRPVAYIMSRYPKLSETFILREMLQLKALGQPLLILPLRKTREPVQHPEVLDLSGWVHYTSFLSFRIVWDNLFFLVTSPGRYFSVLIRSLWETRRSANLFFGAVAYFPKSVHFARLCRSKDAVHVHAHFATHPALAAYVISSLTGLEYSFTAHAHDIFVRTDMLPEKAQKARFVVAISEFNRRYLLKLCSGLDPNKILVIRCGVDVDRYPFIERPPARPLRLLQVGTLQPYKGTCHLIEACGQLKKAGIDFRCRIVGEGPERANLESLIQSQDLEGQVRLLGACSGQEVLRELGWAHVFVLPSVVASDNQMEGIPVALMEAMATGLPVICTSISGIPELIDDGQSGLLVSPGDSRALARAISALSEDFELCKEMGVRGRQKVEDKFNLKKNTILLLNEFNQSGRHIDRSQVEAVLSEPALQFLGSNGIGARKLEVREFPGGADSRIFITFPRNASDPESRKVVVKFHRPHLSEGLTRLEQGRKCASNEHRALSSLHRLFSQNSRSLKVPRPLGFCPQSAATLMEWVDGARLDQRFRWLSFYPSRFLIVDLTRRMRECGEWLALLHTITRSPLDPDPIYEGLRDSFRSDLVQCRKLGLPGEVAEALPEWFEGESKSVLDGRHPVVGRHSDFAPNNVLVNGRALYVIDFEGYGKGVPATDLAHFVAVLEMTPSYHLNRATKDLLIAGFLSGYGVNNDLSTRDLSFFLTLEMLTLMAKNPILQKNSTGLFARLSRVRWRHRWNRWFEREGRHRA